MAHVLVTVRASPISTAGFLLEHVIFTRLPFSTFVGPSR